jgi:prepilin-type N-terminal cleavage/methylation domain-containing protein
MKKAYNTSKDQCGFSLAEVLAALVIAALVLVTVLGIYNRAESCASTINRRLDNYRLPSEVLQRIAEDLDRIIVSDTSVGITIKNKFENGYPTAQLGIRKVIHDSRNQQKVFEEITWQTSYDYDADSLVLYRRRTSDIGLLEDKLLDESRESWEQELFVPVCTGITFFRIQAVKDGESLEKWVGTIPAGIEIMISFAEPFQTLENTLDVPEEQKYVRSIAIDRTRKIGFKIASKEQETSETASGLPVKSEAIGEGMGDLPVKSETTGERMGNLPGRPGIPGNRIGNPPGRPGIPGNRIGNPPGRTGTRSLK